MALAILSFLWCFIAAACGQLVSLRFKQVLPGGPSKSAVSRIVFEHDPGDMETRDKRFGTMLDNAGNYFCGCYYDIPGKPLAMPSDLCGFVCGTLTNKLGACIRLVDAAKNQPLSHERRTPLQCGGCAAVVWPSVLLAQTRFFIAFGLC